MNGVKETSEMITLKKINSKKSVRLYSDNMNRNEGEAHELTSTKTGEGFAS